MTPDGELKRYGHFAARALRRFLTSRLSSRRAEGRHQVTFGAYRFVPKSLKSKTHFTGQVNWPSRQ
ncbi:hypothetical protein KCP70_19275 [Salmonella enterica subsp. enterica]|nr:hypothetical protein KCP70_19275 [Salmonella enterica subsp. enterica]